MFDDGRLTLEGAATPYVPEFSGYIEKYALGEMPCCNELVAIGFGNPEDEPYNAD
jgi:hypothetical protein